MRYESGKASMTEPVSPAVLRRYYDLGWERRWLARMTDGGVPGDAGYKLRLRRTIDLVKAPRARPFRVLDAGCGVGIYSVNVARRFPTARVLGIDLSAVQIEAATDLADQFGVDDRVEFQTTDLTRSDLEASLPHGWDVILLAEILEHLPDPAPVLSTIRKLAAPGGQIIVSVPQWRPDDPGEPWISHRVLTGKANLESVESRDPATLPPGEVFTYYHRHYRSTEVQALLLEAGLAIRHRETVFWQRPANLTGVTWRALDYLLRQTAWNWLDRALQTVRGSEWAHNLLWDCYVPEGNR